MNRHSVRTVNAVYFLFSPHHATSSLYGKIKYRHLPPLPGENTRGVTSKGLITEYLLEGVLALPQIWFPGREIFEVLKYSVC